jgi:hypothetical protein
MLGMADAVFQLVGLRALMRGLTDQEAEILTIAGGPRHDPIFATPEERRVAEGLIARGRAIATPAPEYGPNARRLHPSPAGRVALMIHRLLKVGV